MSRKSTTSPSAAVTALTPDEVFFKESLKWSVLRSEQETKVKNDISTTGEEWILNPIYSPYFNISYRKRRKLELSADDVTTLIRGSYDERRCAPLSLLQKMDGLRP